MHSAPAGFLCPPGYVLTKQSPLWADLQEGAAVIHFSLRRAGQFVAMLTKNALQSDIDVLGAVTEHPS